MDKEYSKTDIVKAIWFIIKYRYNYETNKKYITYSITNPDIIDESDIIYNAIYTDKFNDLLIRHKWHRFTYGICGLEIDICNKNNIPVTYELIYELEQLAEKPNCADYWYPCTAEGRNQRLALLEEYLRINNDPII